MRKRVGIVLATIVVALAVWVHALGESAAQLRAIFDGVEQAGRRSVVAARAHAPPQVADRAAATTAAGDDATIVAAARSSAAAPTLEEPQRLTPSAEALQHGADAHDDADARAGPPSGTEFAELLDGGFLHDVEPEAVEEFRRAYLLGRRDEVLE